MFPAARNAAPALAAAPIGRTLFLYMRSRPEGRAKEFIDWILADAGQAHVASAVYIPLRAGESGKGLAESGEGNP